MKKTILSLLLAVGLIGSSSAAVVFSEDFRTTELNSNLLVPSDYAIGNSHIGATGVRRDYIRTTSTAYNTIDFKMALTINLDNSSDANGIAWVGIGSGLADPNWSYQPMNAGYAVLEPFNWGGGGFGIDAISVPSELASLVANGTAQWNARSVSTQALGNTVRLEMTKMGDNLCFKVDPNYNGTSFNPVYGDSFSIYRYLPFLNASNSSLFFGSGNNTSFSDLSISSVPEPSTYALFGLGAVGMLMVMRRKKTA
jgi:hypothetical protein